MFKKSVFQFLADELGNTRSIITIEKDVSEMGTKIDGTIKEEEVIELKITEEEKRKESSSSNPHHDQFSMDPIFNEIIEPSLRFNTGNQIFTSNRSFFYDILVVILNGLIMRLFAVIIYLCSVQDKRELELQRHLNMEQGTRLQHI